MSLADDLRAYWETQPEPIELYGYQRPPADLGNKEGWLLLAGRGAGKTLGTMRYLSELAHQYPGLRARIIAPTLDDAVNSCVLDPDSGLIAHDDDARLVGGLGGTRVEWPNKSVCFLRGTPTLKDVDRMRALTNIDIDIFEEAAANPMLARAVEQAGFSRRGKRLPQTIWIGTTTPRPTAQIKAWVKDANVICVRASSYDNPNLPERYMARLEAIRGTRLHRQEANAEILEDAEGARWKTEWLDRSRVYDLPDEIDAWGVAVDPASGSGTTGIIGGCRADGHIYWTDDVSVSDGTPEQWAHAAVTLAEERGATIYAEDNQGGRMVESTIKNTGTQVRVVLVRAKISKELRADPIALLWEKEPPTGHIVGSMPLLEDQLVSWEPYVNGKKNRDSPDRMDAAVWLGTMLRVPDTGSVSTNPASVGVSSRGTTLSALRGGR